MAARKTERLLNLVMCLLSTTRYLTAEQIRDAVPQYAEAKTTDAFKRMLERDKEELRELGIPLETGSHSVWDDEPGYRIARRDYELPEITLEPDEAATVALAARAWQSAALSEAATWAVRKLAAAGVETDSAVPRGLEPRVEASEPAFLPLVDAVTERRPVTFRYRPADAAEPSTRRLQPWGVVSWHGRWYAVGHDADRGATRVFRLGRIVGDVRPDGEPHTVVVPDGVDLRAAVASYAALPPVGVARLRVSRGHGADLRRDGRVVGTEGECDVVEVEYADVERLADRVGWYGADVVVLEPVEARELVLARLRRLAADEP